MLPQHKHELHHDYLQGQAVSPIQQTTLQQQQHLQQLTQQHLPQQIIDPNDPLSNSSNIFNDTISPFFAPYGIDVSHFPLTNPPIFESALYNIENDSEPRSRRRISISNGQIGQIITNHTLNNDDLYDIQPPPYPTKAFTPQISHAQLEIRRLQQQQAQQAQAQAQQAPSLQQLHLQPQPIVNNIIPAPNSSIIEPPQSQQPFQTNNQGMPNEKLIYNNEIIFNPDAGPIPGTAAWKKARLLERNRIAASKCRQRKKAAQMQLREDIVNYEKEIEKLEAKNEVLMDLYEFIKNHKTEDASVKEKLDYVEAVLSGDIKEEEED